MNEVIIPMTDGALISYTDNYSKQEENYINSVSFELTNYRVTLTLTQTKYYGLPVRTVQSIIKSNVYSISQMSEVYFTTWIEEQLRQSWNTSYPLGTFDFNIIDKN